MKRKYPFSFFAMGLLLNLVKFAFVGLAGAVLLIIGFLGVSVFKIIGIVILGAYLLLCIINQITIMFASVKESDDAEYNAFMDNAFGTNKSEDYAGSPQENIIKMVEDKIKAQKSDFED